MRLPPLTIRATPLSRKLHVQAAPTHSPLTPQTTTSVVPPQQTSPLYTTLGQPPSLLQVSLTPSLPTYIQMNSLLSLSPLRDVYATQYWLSPLKRILLGWHTWRFQRVEGTVPATALVKSDVGSALYVLGMDGKRDYAVFPRRSVLSFAGPALRVDTIRVPYKVLRQKNGKWFGKNSEMVDSGLARQLGYTLLQGRGDVVLQGKGEVYKLVLGVEEEIVVKRDALVGVSITGELDCIERWSLKNQGADSVESITVPTGVVDTLEETAKLVPVKQWSKIKTQLFTASKSVAYYIKRIWGFVSPSGSGYLKITGPRTVLLQSGTATSAFGSLTKSFRSGEPISIVEQKLQEEALKYREHKPEDLLSYAVVKDGKVSFHATPDFKETVDKLEKHREKAE